MGGFSQYAQKQDESSNWRPFVIAGVCVLIVLAIVWALSRGRSSGQTSTPPPPYAANLKIGDLHLSTAENFVGGRVTYLEGKLANTGDQTLTGASLECVFRNNLGEVVDRQVQPVRVASTPLGNPDWLSLGTAPLAPGKMVEFRLTFEHISADWNQGYPELNFVSLTTK